MRARGRSSARERERILGSLVHFQLYRRMSGWLWDEQTRFSGFAGTSQVYFAFQYSAVFDPATGFWARSLLVRISFSTPETVFFFFDGG